MQIIGTGVGRTGTYSLKLAVNQLGFGPCHHMEEVLLNMPVQLPLWSAALRGEPDWPAIFHGYQSAVDWPTAGFFRELFAAYPTARFVLTHRSPDTWADSFGETIYKVAASRDQAPPEKRDWLEMAAGVIARTGFPDGLDRAALIQEYLPGPEFGIGLIGNPGTGLVALPAITVDFSGLPEGLNPILSYESKTIPDSPYWTEIKYGPATLTDAQREGMVNAARLLFGRLGLRDYARFDFRTGADGRIKLMEVNPNPAWGYDGKMALMAGIGGKSYADLLDSILTAALRRVHAAQVAA